MNVRERVFERWVNAGDDRTFEEWRVYRRKCAEEMRRQSAFSRALARVPRGQSAQGLVDAHWRLRAELVKQQQQELYPKYAPGGLGSMGGLLRGVLG